MKKVAKGKLVLGREVVKALVIELRHAALQDARGGVDTTLWTQGYTCVSYKSLLEGAACTTSCATIDR